MASTNPVLTQSDEWGAVFTGEGALEHVMSRLPADAKVTELKPGLWVGGVQTGWVRSPLEVPAEFGRIAVSIRPAWSRLLILWQVLAWVAGLTCWWFMNLGGQAAGASGAFMVGFILGTVVVLGLGGRALMLAGPRLIEHLRR